MRKAWGEKKKEETGHEREQEKQRPQSGNILGMFKGEQGGEWGRSLRKLAGHCNNLGSYL